MTPRERKSIFAEKKHLLSGLIGGIVLFGSLYGAIQFIGIDTIQETIKKGGAFSPLIFILAKISTIVFAPLAGGFLYFLAGQLFGFWKGFTYTLVGDIFGGSIAFFISRRFGKKAMRYFLSEHGMRSVDDMLSHMGNWKGFIVTRLIFAGMYDLISYAAGLSKLPFWHFAFISMALSAPAIALIVGAGLALVDRAFITLGVLALFGVASVTLTLIALRWIKKRKQSLAEEKINE